VLRLTPVTLWFVALPLACILMLATWLISIKIRNAGIVDIAWSGGFTLIAVLYFFAGTGWTPRKALITVMVSLWSLRLAIHLYRRVLGHHPKEDARYADFRKKWGVTFDSKMFGFFQIQAALLWVLTLPFFLACVNFKSEFSWLERIAVGLWVIGFCGEILADRELSQFVRNPDNRGTICQKGLWKYSRHPNYFFEWVIWVSYGVFALGQPHGVWALYCPALMLYFLIEVTGVKLSEKGSLTRKGELYREYQKTTSSFIPWFPKKVQKP